MDNDSNMKPDCYKCKYRHPVSGDAHSSCYHPDTGQKELNLRKMIVAHFVLNIKADDHGVNKGWFNWPINFDPIWLRNCEGFTANDT